MRTMSTALPTLVASVTATTLADAPGPSRPRLHVNAAQLPCDAFSETSFVRGARRSLTLSPLTSAAATEDRFLTVIVHVSRPPTATVVGLTVLVTTRSRIGSGPGGGGG